MNLCHSTPPPFTCFPFLLQDESKGTDVRRIGFIFLDGFYRGEAKCRFTPCIRAHPISPVVPASPSQWKGEMGTRPVKAAMTGLSPHRVLPSPLSLPPRILSASAGLLFIMNFCVLFDIGRRPAWSVFACSFLGLPAAGPILPT